MIRRGILQSTIQSFLGICSLSFEYLLPVVGDTGAEWWRSLDLDLMAD